MILVCLVNTFQTEHERIEQMNRLGGRESTSRLTLQETREDLSLHILGDQNRDWLSLQVNDFLGMVVDDNGTPPELVELPGVHLGGLVAWIALGEKQLGGSLYLRVLFPNLVDLTLPTATETGYDLVFSSDDPPGFQVE